MAKAVISSTGLHTPPYAISNQELVDAFNQYVDIQNDRHKAAIEAGEREPLVYSSCDFIYKASGIESRYVVDKEGLLDPTRMRPRIRQRSDDEPSLMAEIAMDAGRQALDAAGRSPEDVDMLLVACSNPQRAYPAVSIELQHHLGLRGFAFDMNVACASAAFGIQTAYDAIRSGTARSVLMVNPEICTGHLNYMNRDCHFIFGDACTAMLIEADDRAPDGGLFEVLGTRTVTQFSNNIRNNFGYLNPAEDPVRDEFDQLFKQQGRKVFKEVTPLVSQLVVGHIEDLGINVPDIKRLWLHQANINMNKLIAKKVYGRDARDAELPSAIHEYGNTSSASPVIVFHLNSGDLQAGDVGVLCGFGAGYSAGSVVVRRL
ncbi:MAG: beta-ketoacyl-ACP synthase III [Salinisphaeraceae bacterium]|nr:beta-ketoacyl-ACP synthase III [Salinisphaeraceae bacterium]